MRLKEKSKHRVVSIRTKLILTLGFTALLALFMMAGSMVTYETYNAKKNLIDELVSMANVVALNASYSIKFMDQNEASNDVSTLSAKQGIIGAILYDAQGTIYADFSRGAIPIDTLAHEVGQICKPDMSPIEMISAQKMVSGVTNGHAHVILPVIYKEDFVGAKGEFVGAIHLIDDMQQQKTRLAAYYLIVAGTVVITLAVVLILSSKMQSIFTRPLFDVIESMGQVTRQKDYQVRVKKYSDDEFGVLVEQFNQMIEEIQARDEELNLYSSNLESMVKQRTEELQSTIIHLKKAQKKAEEASQVKSQFLANMSHEIRTPMHGILGMTEILLKSQLSSEQESFAINIQKSAKALLAIINDILDFSKIEAGKLEIESIAFDIGSLLTDIKTLLMFAARDKNLNLTVDIQKGAHLFLVGDPTRIRQVLINLVNNAIKFTKKGGVTIMVSTSLVKESEFQSVTGHESRVNLTIAVKDTGIGISSDKQKLLFSPFYQADASSARQYEGSGLGLAICSDLVSLMGGTIRCTSKQGQGSIFSFVLPLKKAEKSIIEPSFTAYAARPPKTEKINLHVLVAEDNITNQEVFSAMLESFGCSADIAPTGVDARDMFIAQKPDIILMDCQMPIMDGYQATREIRKHEATLGLHTPIIAITAHAMADDQNNCRDAGMDDFLTKPFMMEDLKMILRKWAPHRGPDSP